MSDGSAILACRVPGGLAERFHQKCVEGKQTKNAVLKALIQGFVGPESAPNTASFSLQKSDENGAEELLVAPTSFRGRFGTKTQQKVEP